MRGEKPQGFLAKPGLDHPEPRAWAMYDWANSAMVTVIITAIFPIYFKNVAAEGLDGDFAQKWYGYATSIALIIVAFIAPVLGAVADVKAAKKKLLLSFAAVGVAATACLYFVQHGDWVLGLVLFGVANVGAAGSVVFYDALLPHVARAGETDRLSTAGYAVGYVGGGLVLGLSVLCIQKPEWFGLPSGDGLSAAQETLPARLSFVVVALWWAIFTIPLWRRVSEPPRALEPDERPGESVVKASFQRLGETFKELRRYKHALLMLVAFLIFNDGIQTIIRMAVIYASSKELDDGVVMTTIFAIQFVGIPFAFLFGHVAGRFGAKRMVLFGLVVYCAISVLGYFMSTEMHFIALGALVGMVQGGTQGLSRSLFASLIPKHKSGEFFAFFAVGEKFAGILGPTIFALVIEATGSPQTAILAIIAFFVIGGGLLVFVDVEEGRRIAQEVDEQMAQST